MTPTLSPHYAALDPGGMFDALLAFPDHLREGWSRGAGADDWAREARSARGVVICGMGGSAIGGDLLRTLSGAEANVPVQVVRGYDVPAWVGGDTLVIASSYSGGTEETRSAFAAARARGARMAVIASGGPLLDTAREADIPYVVIPGGLQPRAALGYSLGVLLRLGRALDLLSLSDDTFTAAADAAEARARAYAEEGSAPHGLADALEETLPVIYSATDLLDAVNARWRNQLHENAKVLAYGNVFPELNHNEIVGFGKTPDAVLRRLAVVVLRDESEHAQNARRVGITRGLLEEGIAGWYEVETEGPSPLARVLSLVQLGDWLSFWLALRLGVDPTPVESIGKLKEALAR